MSGSRPKILFVSYTADWTGPTNSLLLLLQHLRERYQTAVLLPGTGLFTDRLDLEGIPYFSFPVLDKWAVPSMARLVQRERFDLVYGNSVHGSSRNAAIAAQIVRKPFACHVREIGWRMTWRKIGFLRFADAVVAVSEACAASVARFVPPKRLHVVHNGVKLSDFQLPFDEARRHLLSETGLSSTDIILVSVGHVCERKGQLYNLAAFEEVVKEEPHAKLLLVGSLDREPAYVEQVKTRIREKGLDQHVHVVGFRRDAVQLLQGADVLVHTALREPHPRAVIEAMAARLPVAAFDTDGVAETVVEGQTGYLVAQEDSLQLASALDKLVKDASLRKRMGEAGRLRVEKNYGAELTAEKIAGIVDSLLR